MRGLHSSDARRGHDELSGFYFGQVAQSAEEVVRAIGVGEDVKITTYIHVENIPPSRIYLLIHIRGSNHAKDCDTHDPAVGQ